MSKSQNPMTGHMSGSMANFATYKRYGKNIIRSKAFEPKDANTVSQKAQRASFKLIVNAYESFGGITDTSFPKRAENQSPFNAFVAANLPEAIDKTGAAPVIVYRDLKVSAGTLPVVQTTAVIDTDGITLSYESDLGNPRVSVTDQVIAFAQLKSGKLLIVRKVRGNFPTGTLLLTSDGIKASDVVCCYLFVQKADGSNASNSTYVAVN